MFLKWMLQSKEFTLKQNASKQERHWGNRGKLSV